MTRLLKVAAFSIAVVLGAVGIACLWEMARYREPVGRLARGVGDTEFLTADGAPWFRLDRDRHDVRIAAISADLQRAVVAIEDRRFFDHPGIDVIGLGRAVVRNLRAGRRAEGGSTITQQLARTLFLSNTRTFARKGKEAAIALEMERQLSKTEILELYLNRVYLGAGVYGVEAMSEHLFRKPAATLSLSEAALLAGLIRAPSTLSPWLNYDGALARSHLVLRQMHEQGMISAEQETAARSGRPTIQPYRQAREDAGGWAKDFLRQQFRNEFGGDSPPGWTVHTSFVRPIQTAAETAVASGLARLHTPGLEAALVALDPATGDVLAMVGGSSYARSTFNRATRAKRQAGSAFKPLVYAAALSHGYSPVSVLDGLSKTSTPGDPEWMPSAGEHGAEDALTLRAALRQSNNPAAAVLQQRLSSGPVLKLAADAGLVDQPDVPSLALGAGSVTPLDLTTAFAMFPAGGWVATPRALVRVVDADGGDVFAPAPARRQVLSEDVAFQMTSMLADVIDAGTGRAARAWGVAGPVAGKTGTSDDYHDAWFVGFSRTVVAGVWVGFDQPAPIGRDAYAARIAVPIWAEFMKDVSRVRPAAAFAIPKGVTATMLCRVSGQRPVDGCPTYTEYFKEGDDVPAALCAVHAGSFGQRAERAVGGFFRSLGGRLSALFRRK